VGVPVADVTNYNSAQVNQRTVLTESGQLMSISNADFLMASLSKGWDACVWNTNYTVVSYSQGGTGYIGVIYHDPSTNAATWNAAEIGSLTSVYCIKLLMGQDNKMYFTNGNTIGSITAITGTGGSVSVTSSSNVLDLPPGVFAVTLTELGNNLLIGTQKGPTYESRQDYNWAAIYPWDRVSASFSLPVYINENGMNAMISHRNQVYFSAGDNANIYVTDGTNYQLVKHLPYTKINRYNPTSWVYPNAMCINQQGHLMVGLSANYDANSPTITGIWEIALTSGYPTHLPFFSRDGNLGQTANVRFGSVRVLDDDALAFGVQTGTSYELSVTSATALNTSYTARWRTEAFFVGTARTKKTFEQLEFMFSKPLIANQGIKISYRKNLTDSFTEIGTWTYSDIGGVISHLAPAQIADAELLQFEIAVNYSSAVFGNNVNLIRVLVY